MILNLAIINMELLMSELETLQSKRTAFSMFV